MASNQQPSRQCDTTQPATVTLEDLRRRQQQRATDPPPEAIAAALPVLCRPGRADALEAERSARREAAEQAARARATAEATARLAAQLGRRYTAERASLDAFVCRLAEQKAVVARLRALLPTLTEFASQGRGMVFFGTVGTGKDHLLAAMLYGAVAAGLSVRWIDGQDLFRRFRDGIDKGESEESLIKELTGADVLAISDVTPDAKDPTWQQGRLKAIIDRRYRELRGTWVTMNALSADDADAKLSAPVFDRLREGAELFRCFWPSHREGARVGA